MFKVTNGSKDINIRNIDDLDKVKEFDIIYLYLNDYVKIKFNSISLLELFIKTDFPINFNYDIDILKYGYIKKKRIPVNLEKLLSNILEMLFYSRMFNLIGMRHKRLYNCTIPLNNTISILKDSLREKSILVDIPKEYRNKEVNYDFGVYTLDTSSNGDYIYVNMCENATKMADILPIIVFKNKLNNFVNDMHKHNILDLNIYGNTIMIGDIAYNVNNKYELEKYFI